MAAPRKKKKKGIQVSRWLLLLQVAALAASIWLLCAEWAPLAASESPVRLAGGALLYLLLAWACAFGLTLWTYMAISLDDFRDLRAAALRTSVRGLWFVPAMLLVSVSPSPAIIAIGILMMVNAARLLVASPPPQKRALSRRRWRMQHRLFGEARVQRGFLTKETSPAVLGAFSLQAGAFAAWAGHQQWAAALFAGGIASWTWSSIARGAYQPGKRKHQAHTALSAVLAVVLTMALSVVSLGSEAAATGGVSGAPGDGLLEATRREMQQLVNPPKAKPAAAKPKPAAMRVFVPRVETDTLGKGGIPGLILQPGKKKPQSVTIPPTYHLRITLSPSKPVSIPFTGEYHLFRESSVQLPPGAEQRAGSPLDAVYVTTNGGAMETDAYQEFDPPVDFTSCGKIRLTLTSGEMLPGSATLILQGAQKIGEFGPEIFGMSGTDEETVEFALPALPAGVLVTGIRVIFLKNPMEASHSTQVAIRGFTFIPRGL